MATVGGYGMCETIECEEVKKLKKDRDLLWQDYKVATDKNEEYGYVNVKLRKENKELKEENNRLSMINEFIDPSTLIEEIKELKKTIEAMSSDQIDADNKIVKVIAEKNEMAELMGKIYHALGRYSVGLSPDDVSF